VTKFFNLKSIFSIAQKIHENLPEKILTLEEYPNLNMGGKENIRINPALELIKAICKVNNILLLLLLLLFESRAG
jgi:hypothetical protein